MRPGAEFVLVKACLNGRRSRNEHEAVPLSPPELAAAAQGAVAAGAAALHVHPRHPDGSETLDPVVCGATIRAIRAACSGVPVGLTTGASIEPDPGRRLSLVDKWTIRPDFASVNFSEAGAADLCDLLIRRGIGIEVGLSSVADVQAFLESGMGERCLRVLVEPEEDDLATAVLIAAMIDAGLNQAGLELPRLQHGFGMATWAVLDAALDRGQDIRIGLEDTLYLPNSNKARDNAELVTHAVHLVREHGFRPAPSAVSSTEA